MSRLFRIAAVFFVLVSIGCAGARTGTSEVAIDSAAAAGSWTLTDDENTAFDVHLSEAGSAVSNWSKGQTGAQGEQGKWRIVDGRIVIDYTDGWRDVIIGQSQGRFRKESFAPNTPRDGVPTTAARAVRTRVEFVPWIGVFELQAAESGSGRGSHVAIQSNFLAWRSPGELPLGTWWITDGALRIRWASGGVDELRRVGSGFQVRSWKPGAPLDAAGLPLGEPTSVSTARQVR